MAESMAEAVSKALAECNGGDNGGAMFCRPELSVLLAWNIM